MAKEPYLGLSGIYQEMRKISSPPSSLPCKICDVEIMLAYCCFLARRSLIEEVSETCVFCFFFKSKFLQAQEPFLWRSNRCLPNTNSAAPGRSRVSSSKVQPPKALFLYITHVLQWRLGLWEHRLLANMLP